MKRTFWGLFLIIVLGGCATTLPTESYVAQNSVRFGGSVVMGDVRYVPADEGKVRPNQVQNTALGSIMTATDIADLVKRATVLELEKSGVKLDANSPVELSADVLEMKADDLGYSIRWSYAVRYVVHSRATGDELYNNTYVVDKVKTGKFNRESAYSTTLNNLVLAGYEMFAEDRAMLVHLASE